MEGIAGFGTICFMYVSDFWFSFQFRVCLNHWIHWRHWIRWRKRSSRKVRIVCCLNRGRRWRRWRRWRKRFLRRIGVSPPDIHVMRTRRPRPYEVFVRIAEGTEDAEDAAGRDFFCGFYDSDRNMSEVATLAPTYTFHFRCCKRKATYINYL